MKLQFSLLIVVLLIFGFACANSSQEKQCVVIEPINPNGDSELSLLMREMFEDAMRMKGEVKNGKTPDVLKKFKKIHTAEATEPEKAESDEFKAFADSYLAAVDALEKSKPDEAAVFYRGMVESCMNCHRSMCPGPMVRIKKLRLSYEE